MRHNWINNCLRLRVIKCAMISLEYNNIVTPAVVPSIHISHGNTPHRIMCSHLSPSLADCCRETASSWTALHFVVACVVMIVFGEQKHRVRVTFWNQKFGGSPYFPPKGGHMPPFYTLSPLFEERVPADFFKKKCPQKLQKRVLTKYHSTKITTGYTIHQIPVTYQYRSDGHYQYRNGMQYCKVLQKQRTTGTEWLMAIDGNQRQSMGA